MAIFVLSNATDDWTREVWADEIDTIAGRPESGLVVYLSSGEEITCDYVVLKDEE